MSCSALNCTNRSTQGFRLFRFPVDPERRKIWIINCGRHKWTPTDSARLCNVHFEDNQFENKRTVGLTKLKCNAVPTIFNVPNPPKNILTTKKSIYKCNNCDQYIDEIASLKQQIKLLEKENAEKEKKL